jgi:hypothetical protein
MRCLSIPALLLLSACRQEPEPVANEPAAATAEQAGSSSTFAGSGRDRLCLAEGSGRAGLITFGEGDANCSVTGSLARSDDRLTITPDGDAACRVEATLAGDRLTLGPAATACAYYCGPSASFAGKQFTRTKVAEPVTDLAGDPLC